jgi:hypothetical protein
LSHDLAILGLQPGETVRWRSAEGSRWQTGRATGRERDGSVAVTDSRGARRSFVIDRLEVRRAGPRGGGAWEPLIERAARSEQLKLI